MATKQFGNSAKDLNGGLVPRQWGYEDGEFWLFGESYSFYIFKRLLDYLPRYVVRNELCQTIMFSVAVSMRKWELKFEQLLGYRLKGGKVSRHYANKDLQLFINNKASDHVLVESIKNRYAIHKKRGTYEGVIEDIKRLSGDDNLTTEFLPMDEVGWIMNETFPDDNNDYFNNCYLGLDNMLNVIVRNKSGLTDREFIGIIRADFVPLTINIRILILKSRYITWGEPHNGSLLFGTFQYGYIDEEGIYTADYDYLGTDENIKIITHTSKQIIINP